MASTAHHGSSSPGFPLSQCFRGWTQQASSTDAEAEVPPDEKSRFTGKDPDAGRDWGQEEKGTTEDEMAGWHHWLKGREFKKLWERVKDRETQHARSWGHKRSDMPERLNKNSYSSSFALQWPCDCFPLFVITHRDKIHDIYDCLLSMRLSEIFLEGELLAKPWVHLKFES